MDTKEKVSSELSTKKSANAAWEKVGSTTFPFSEAFRFSLESIRKRFMRSIITMLSVLLGIAFMVTMLTMRTIFSNIGKELPGEYQIWIVIISLLVCGVGIVNSMLMSVTERYKEIGTIKCLGATDTNVLEIFLIEALLLGLLGGLIGAFAGWIVAIGVFGSQFGIGSVFPAINLTKALVDYLTYIGSAIGVAAFLSVAAAAYPAFYAARLNPSESLRYEV